MPIAEAGGRGERRNSLKDGLSVVKRKTTFMNLRHYWVDSRLQNGQSAEECSKAVRQPLTDFTSESIHSRPSVRIFRSLPDTYVASASRTKLTLLMFIQKAGRRKSKFANLSDCHRDYQTERRTE